VVAAARAAYAKSEQVRSDPDATTKGRRGRVDPLERIYMKEKDGHGCGRGRLPPGITRRGPKSRRGVRGEFSGRGTSWPTRAGLADEFSRL
jgi:hypothetical protein